MKIELNHRNVEYTLKVSKRARRMRLVVYCDGSFVVTIPRHARQNLIEQFIVKKAQWVLGKIEHFKKFPGRIFKNDASDFIQYKKKASVFVLERVEYFAKLHDFSYNKVNIKNQTTRWGSCSRKGNLNFNYRITFLPRGLANYLIVHELCHLKEFNHSRKFWNLVGAIMPDYLELRRELRKNRMTV